MQVVGSERQHIANSSLTVESQLNGPVRSRLCFVVAGHNVLPPTPRPDVESGFKVDKLVLIIISIILKSLFNYFPFNYKAGNVSHTSNDDKRWLLTKSAELIDIENNVRTTNKTVWRLGSTSKALTSGLVAKLIDDGLLDLDRSIHDYLSQELFPRKKWGKRVVDITLRQIMSHTAGLTQEAVWYKNDKWPLSLVNVTQQLEPWKDHHLVAEPGTACAYSNNGYVIVGAIIEQVTGRTFDVVFNEFSQQLGLNSTRAEKIQEIIPDRARYYMLNAFGNGTIGNARTTDDLIADYVWWPVGAISSTTNDLITYGQLLLASWKGEPNC